LFPHHVPYGCCAHINEQGRTTHAQCAKRVCVRDDAFICNPLILVAMQSTSQRGTATNVDQQEGNDEAVTIVVGTATQCTSQLNTDAFRPLWTAVAVYCPPKTVCSLECTCRKLHDVLTASKSGGGLLQKYWHARCFVLRWCADDVVPTPLKAAPVDEQKRRLLQHVLTKAEAKRHWKLEYQLEYEACLRRNLRGVGVCHQSVVRNVTGTVLSAPLAETHPTLDPTMDVDHAALREAVEEEATKDAFVRMCLDGGIPTHHFTSVHGSTVATSSSSCKDGEVFERRDYRKNKSLGKRKEKHNRGSQAVWDTWVDDNYDY
jgi:hypothetical protein